MDDNINEITEQLVADIQQTPPVLPAEVIPEPVPAEESAPPEPVEVVGVRFKVGGKVYFFDPSGVKVEQGQDVIIETSRGLEYGQCAQGNRFVAPDRVVQPLRPVVRVATDKDMETLDINRRKEKKAFEICQQKITEHKLDMKLIDVEYSFDGSKILFFFTSDGRVDFRELVKNLASVFRTRIELRQIGVRDEAKMLGGLGICGRPFCCSSFLDDFHPVSIKMAKTQNLSLNPTKISGCCGRLMCCLKYEQDAYEDMVKRTPKVESYVETPLGNGVVTDVSLLKATVKVVLDNEPDAYHIYKTNEINVLHNGSRLKKSAPLLPPDPPVVYEELEEDKQEYPEIIYSDNRAVDKAPAAPAAEKPADDQKKRSRRSRNRKKPADGEQRADAPKTEQPKALEGQKPQNRQRQQQKPKAPAQNQAAPQNQGQKQGSKPQQPRQKKPQTEQKAEAPKVAAVPAADGEVKPKPKSSNRRPYYRNRRKGGDGQKSGGESKPE